MKRILLMTIFIMFNFAVCMEGKTEEVSAKSGIINLRNWDFGKDKTVRLKGEWIFYWNELLTPEEAALRDTNTTMKFPGIWKKNGHPTKGYATYKLTVLLKNGKYGFRIPSMDSNYKLYIDNEQVIENGHVGRDEKTSVPFNLVRYEYFEVKNNKLELVLQISNFHHARGGQRGLIELGEEEEISYLKQKYCLVDTFEFASLFFICIYHLFIFLLRRKEISSLYFGIAAMFIGMRIAVTGEKLLVVMFPYESMYTLFYRIEYLSIIIMPCFIMLFLYKLLNKRKMKYLVYLYIAAGSIIALKVCFSTVYSFTNMLFLVNVYAGIVIATIMYILIREVIKRREGSGILFLAVITANIGGIHDILVGIRVVNDAYLFPKFATASVYILALFLAFRFTKSFRLTEAYMNKIEQQNQKLIEKDKIKEDILANTSHELRTPLNGIIGISESLIDGVCGEVNEQQKNNLRMVLNCGKRLSYLVNDILDMAKLGKSDIELNLQNVNVKMVGESIIDISAVLLKNKEIKMVNKIEKDMWVRGDEQRILQIVQNLVGNAIKFTEKGLIWISAREIEDQIEIEVGDTGIGIPKEKYDAVFDVFTQLERSETRHYEGTGIGLSITKKLVEAHGGKIRVKSILGRGTSFIFTLKKANSELNKDIMKSIITAPEGNSGGIIMPDVKGRGNGFKILAVDDDIVNLQILINYLTASGFKINVESDSKKVMDHIKREKYDLILLDIMMPDISGYEICEMVRKEYSLYDMPIFLLSAKNQEIDKNKGFEKGANDYITKPFDKSELINRINTVMEIKKLIGQLVERSKENLEGKGENI